MTKRIIYNVDGTVAIIAPAPDCPLTIDEIAAKDVPAGLSHRIVPTASIPTDRTFRDAWIDDPAGTVKTDMIRAKVIAHDRRRRERQAAFSPLDAWASIPGAVGVGAEKSRAKIRVKDARKQVDIDAANDEAALKLALEMQI